MSEVRISPGGKVIAVRRPPGWVAFDVTVMDDEPSYWKPGDDWASLAPVDEDETQRLARRYSDLLVDRDEIRAQLEQAEREIKDHHERHNPFCSAYWPTPKGPCDCNSEGETDGQQQSAPVAAPTTSTDTCGETTIPAGTLGARPARPPADTEAVIGARAIGYAGKDFGWIEGEIVVDDHVARFGGVAIRVDGAPTPYAVYPSTVHVLDGSGTVLPDWTRVRAVIEQELHLARRREGYEVKNVAEGIVNIARYGNEFGPGGVS